MTDTDQETKDRQERFEQERQERLERQQERRQEREKRFAHSATDNWLIDQEDFRRMMRTGEFTQTESEPEPQPEAAKAE